MGKRKRPIIFLSGTESPTSSHPIGAHHPDLPSLSSPVPPQPRTPPGLLVSGHRAGRGGLLGPGPPGDHRLCPPVAPEKRQINQRSTHSEPAGEPAAAVLHSFQGGVWPEDSLPR